MNSIFEKRSCLTQREVMQYLNDELSDEQRYDVENHLLDCELCSAAVEGYAHNQDFGSAEEDIQEVEAKVAAAAKGPSRRRLAWINRAAAVLLILIASYAAFRYWSASQPERLFAAYFEPAPNNYITYRSSGAEPNPMPEELKQALGYYNTGFFDLSLPHFTNYLEGKPDDDKALLLAANACLHAGQAERAEQYLLQIEAGEEALRSEVSWYLALAYLQQGQLPRARQYLENVQATPASAFQKKAGEILEKIK
ncbi:MAG: zf-HC2 domain-containing protein [Lewinellaceae bacterium]|nr:zf-HC2 domain-containing protein [Phaeodactylibacter sp.]MCB9347863.1 zf-HC2 domain-containing protein [Lewinellaceae bacterium]